MVERRRRLMVVGNVDGTGLGSFFRPEEQNAPLVIDADAPKIFELSCEFFAMKTWPEVERLDVFDRV